LGQSVRSFFQRWLSLRSFWFSFSTPPSDLRGGSGDIPGRWPSPRWLAFTSVFLKTRLVLSLVALLIASSVVIAVVHEARAEARGRCKARTPPFPARVLGVEVDWQFSHVNYDCVYRLYGGGRLRLP